MLKPSIHFQARKWSVRNCRLLRKLVSAQKSNHTEVQRLPTTFPISLKAEIWCVYFLSLLPAGRLVLVSILPSAGSLLLNLSNPRAKRGDWVTKMAVRGGIVLWGVWGGFPPIIGRTWPPLRQEGGFGGDPPPHSRAQGFWRPGGGR